MSNKLIADIGCALYGERWQTDMARALDVSDSTVRRWAAGTDEPRRGVYTDLHRLVIERITNLEDTLERIKEQEIRAP